MKTLFLIGAAVAATAAASGPSRTSPRVEDPYARLPVAVRAEVARLGCRPPRGGGDVVVAGNLYGAAGQGRARDLAVGCMRASDSRILVFRRGSLPVAADLEVVSGPTRIEGADSTWVCDGMMFLAEGRDLRSTIRGGILADGDSLSAAERRAPVHDGIVDGDCEGTSNVHYWTGRRWVLLAGSD